MDVMAVKGEKRGKKLLLFQNYPAVLVGEDGALLPVSVLRPLYEFYVHVGREPRREVREFAVSVPIFDLEASVAEAVRLVRRFGLVAYRATGS